MLPMKQLCFTPLNQPSSHWTSCCRQKIFRSQFYTQCMSLQNPIKMERSFAKTALNLIYRLHNSFRGESHLEKQIKKSWHHGESKKKPKIQSVGLQSFYSVRPSKSVLKLNSIPTVIISSISLEIELVLPQMLVFSNMDAIICSSLCSFVFVQVIDAIQKWGSHLGCIFLFLPSLVEIVFAFAFSAVLGDSCRNGESCWALYLTLKVHLVFFFLFFFLVYIMLLGCLGFMGLGTVCIRTIVMFNFNDNNGIFIIQNVMEWKSLAFFKMYVKFTA